MEARPGSKDPKNRIIVKSCNCIVAVAYEQRSGDGSLNKKANTNDDSGASIDFDIIIGDDYASGSDVRDP